MANPDVQVTIGADAQNFESVIARATGIARENASKMEAAFSAASGAARALAGAAAVTGLAALVTRTADAADELSQFSQRIGESVEDLSRLKYAASLNDASFSDLEQGLKGLSNKMLDAAKGGGEAAAAFAALGIKVKDSSGNLRGVNAVFGDIADAFAGMEDGAAKTAIANKLMEESGLRLIPTLNNGRAGLKAMADEADRFGATFTKTEAAAAAQFNDNLTRLGVISESVAHSIGNVLIPGINELLAVFQRANQSIGSFGLTLNAQINAAFGVAGDGPLQKQIANVEEMIAKAEGWQSRFPGGIVGTLIGVRTSNLHALLDVLKAQKDLADAANKQADASKNAGDSTSEQSDAAKRSAEALRKLQEELGRAQAASKAAAEASKLHSAELAYQKSITGELGKEIESVNKLLADIAKNQAEGVNAAQDELRALMDQLGARRDEVAQIGLTDAALADLQASRLENAAALKEEKAATLAYFPGGERLAEIYRAQATALRKTAQSIREGSVKEANVKAAEDALKAWQGISDDIAQSISDAILQGGNAWKTLVNQVEATIIRATISPVIQGGVDSFLKGVGLGPKPAGDSGIPGSIGLLGSLGAFGSGLGSAFQALSAVGFGGTLSAAGSLLGTGTASGIGAGLGLGFGVAAPALLAGLAINDLFGSGGTPHRGGAALFSGGSTQAATDALVPDFGLDWGAFRSDRAQAADEAVSRLVDSIGQGILGLSKAGANTTGFRVAGKFASDNDDPSRGGLRVFDAAGNVVFNLDRKYNKAFEKGFQEFADDASRAGIAVLQTLSSTLDPISRDLVQAVDPITSSLDEINAAIGSVSQYLQASDAVSGFGNIEAAMESARRASLNASAQFHAMVGDLDRLANSGTASVDQMLAGMDSVYANFQQLLASIDATSKSIAEQTDASIRNIRFSVLDDPGKYQFLDTEITRQLDVLQSITDPELVRSYYDRITGNLNAAFGLLDQGEQKRLSEDFVSRFEKLGDVAQGRLGVALDQAKDQQRELARIIKDAVREAFAGPSERIDSAATTIANQRVNVAVTIDSPVPALAEVGFVTAGRRG